MTPVRFPEQNIVFGEGQPEYLPLPAHLSDEGCATTCWQLTWQERLRVLVRGKLWLQVLTFNKPIQPQLPSVQNPLDGSGL